MDDGINPPGVWGFARLLANPFGIDRSFAPK
jgi:hypothetical protein